MLEFFHVNMPWQHMPRHFEMIVSRRMNVEIGFDAASLDRVTRSELRTVAGRLDAAGCRTTIHGPFWDLNPGSIDPLIRQVSRCRFQQLFDAAGVFEPLQVVVHTGFDPRHHSGHREAWLANSLASWEPLVERAEKMRIPLLWRMYGSTGPTCTERYWTRSVLHSSGSAWTWAISTVFRAVLCRRGWKAFRDISGRSISTTTTEEETLTFRWGGATSISKASSSTSAEIRSGRFSLSSPTGKNTSPRAWRGWRRQQGTT